MTTMRPLKHTVPTHLKVPDTVLTIGSLSLTARQFLILLIGSSLGYNLWHQLHVFSVYAVVGTGLRVCLALVPALLALLFALVQVAGRPVEVWLFVLARYWTQSKRYVWRSVRRGHQQATPLYVPLSEEETEADGETGGGAIQHGYEYEKGKA